MSSSSESESLWMSLRCTTFLNSRATRRSTSSIALPARKDWGIWGDHFWGFTNLFSILIWSICDLLVGTFARFLFYLQRVSRWKKRAMPCRRRPSRETSTLPSLGSIVASLLSTVFRTCELELMLMRLLLLLLPPSLSLSLPLTLLDTCRFFSTLGTVGIRYRVWSADMMQLA